MQTWVCHRLTGSVGHESKVRPGPIDDGTKLLTVRMGQLAKARTRTESAAVLGQHEPLDREGWPCCIRSPTSYQLDHRRECDSKQLAEQDLGQSRTYLQYVAEWVCSALSTPKAAGIPDLIDLPEVRQEHESEVTGSRKNFLALGSQGLAATRNEKHGPYTAAGSWSTGWLPCRGCDVL